MQDDGEGEDGNQFEEPWSTCTRIRLMRCN
jgi:hypothetical protein